MIFPLFGTSEIISEGLSPLGVPNKRKKIDILQEGQCRAIDTLVPGAQDLNREDKKPGFVLPREKKAQWGILVPSSAT